jgi:protein-S-isoprenylcysteine O-methyltransferase Ste14
VTALHRNAFFGFLFLLVAMAAMLFVPAGTLDYWQAWIFLGVFFVPALAITLYLAKKDPKLLQRRLSAGPAAEKETSQKIIQTVTSAGFIAMLVVPALDRRFHRLSVPDALAVAGDVLVAIGFLVVFFVYRQNSFASATIEVARDQEVVSTGLYSLVRHPMYAGALVLLVGMALALASWRALPVMIVILPVLAWRLLDEESYLTRNLAGYAEYKKKVRYRLVPFLW